MPYSASTTGKAPNVAVSTASTPTSKNEQCISAITSGRVSTTCSLQPSSWGPPKSSAVRFWSCTHVPNAPSKIRTRSRSAARKSDILPRLLEGLRRLGGPSRPLQRARERARSRAWTSRERRRCALRPALAFELVPLEVGDVTSPSTATARARHFCREKGALNSTAPIAHALGRLQQSSQAAHLLH